jgi:hypothetical protein
MGGTRPMKKLQELKYGYLWVTLAFFVFSLVGHWIFGWFAYVQEAKEHAVAVSVSDYTIQMLRDTLENWQSEFLQLIWQVAGLAYLLYVGSPQSREGEERNDALLEHILRKVDPDHGEAIIRELEARYPKR